MKKNLLSMLMLGAAMLFACCTPNDGNGDNSGDDNQVTFAVETANITHTSVDVTITPNNADTWWFAKLYSENELNTYAQGNALTAISYEIDLLMSVVNVYNEGVSESEKLNLLTFGFDEVIKGSATLTASYLLPETTYVVMVAEVNGNGLASQEVTTHKFTSLARPVGKTTVFTPQMATVVCFGDLYGAYTNDIVLDLFAENENGNVTNISLEYFTELDNHDGVGSFVPDYHYTFAAGTFSPGEYYDGYLYPAYYAEMNPDTEEFVAMVALVDGTVSVTKEGSEYTINASLTTEDGDVYKVENYKYSLGEDSYYDECNGSALLNLLKLSNKKSNNHSIKVANPATKVLKVGHLGAKAIRR